MLQTRQTLAMATGLQQRRSSDADASGHYSEGPSAIEAVRRYIESLPQQMPFRTEVRCGRFWRAVWTEFVVTLLFLVIGCGAGVRWISTTGSTESKANPITDDDDDIRAPLAIGLTVAALMQGASHISGCHLNPAVSIALLVTRTITPLRTVLFVLAQCLGAIVGASILYGLTPNDIRIHGLPATVLNRKVHPSQAFGVEFLTSLLIVITLMATYDSLRQGHFCFKGLPVGVAYIVGHLFGVRRCPSWHRVKFGNLVLPKSMLIFYFHFHLIFLVPVHRGQYEPGSIPRIGFNHKFLDLSLG